MALVLLVDDDPVFRGAARCRLEALGLRVLEAGDVLAGLQRAVEDAPACVIVGEALEGFSGWEFAERLAKAPETAALPVVVAAAADRAEPGHRGAGVHAILGRDLDTERWRTALRAVPTLEAAVAARSQASA